MQGRTRQRAQRMSLGRCSRGGTWTGGWISRRGGRRASRCERGGVAARVAVARSPKWVGRQELWVVSVFAICCIDNLIIRPGVRRSAANWVSQKPAEVDPRRGLSRPRWACPALGLILIGLPTRFRYPFLDVPQTTPSNFGQMVSTPALPSVLPALSRRTDPPSPGRRPRQHPRSTLIPHLPSSTSANQVPLTETHGRVASAVRRGRCARRRRAAQGDAGRGWGRGRGRAEVCAGGGAEEDCDESDLESRGEGEASVLGGLPKRVSAVARRELVGERVADFLPSFLHPLLHSTVPLVPPTSDPHLPTVSRIALVRPEKAKSIEQLLMRMAKGGQLRGRVTEDQLIGVLDQVEAAEKGRSGGGAGGASGGGGGGGAGKIVFSRKSRVDESDDDFDL